MSKTKIKRDNKFRRIKRVSSEVKTRRGTGEAFCPIYIQSIGHIRFIC